MSESIEAQLEVARRLLPAPPRQSRVKQMLFIAIGLVAVFIVSFVFFDGRSASERETEGRSPTPAGR